MVCHASRIDEQYPIQNLRDRHPLPIMAAMLLEIIFAVLPPNPAIFQILDIKKPVSQIRIRKLEKPPAVQPVHRPAPVSIRYPEILPDNRLFYMT